MPKYLKYPSLEANGGDVCILSKFGTRPTDQKKSLKKGNLDRNIFVLVFCDIKIWKKKKKTKQRWGV